MIFKNITEVITEVYEGGGHIATSSDCKQVMSVKPGIWMLPSCDIHSPPIHIAAHLDHFSLFLYDQTTNKETLNTST